MKYLTALAVAAMALNPDILSASTVRIDVSDIAFITDNDADGVADTEDTPPIRTDGAGTTVVSGQAGDLRYFPRFADTPLYRTATIWEYDISELTQPVERAELVFSRFENIPTRPDSSFNHQGLVAAFGFSGDGNATRADYDAGGILLGESSSVADNFSEQLVRFDITTFINAEIDRGGDFAGVFFHMVGSFGTGYIVPTSVIGPNGDLSGLNIPHIELTSQIAPVPLPASLPLFLAGIGALCCVGKRWS